MRPAIAALALCLVAGSAASPAPAGDATRLSVSPIGHYLTMDGRAIVLVGDSGTQCVMQDANLDYRRWVDDCAARGLTAVHIWSFVPARQRVDGSVIEERYGYIYPDLTPWQRRNGGPLAADGRPQFDLQHFDEGDGPDHYWPRLRSLCRRARDRGLAVGITVFFGWPKHRADWEYHPLNVRNGGPITDDGRIITKAQMIESPGAEVLDEEWSDDWPVPRKTQWIWERFAEKLIRDTQPLGNVLFVFMDEHSYSEGNCGDHFLRFFRRRRALYCDWDRRREDVDLVMSPTVNDVDKNAGVVAGVMASPARPYLFLEGPPYMGDEVRTSLWTTLIGGGHFLFHDDSGQETPQTGIMGYDAHVRGGDKGMVRRDWLGHASRFMNECVDHLDEMRPSNALCPDGGYCLAAPGREMVIYAPMGNEGRIAVDLSGLQGECTVRLYDPRSGRFANERRIAGGAVEVFPLPDRRDWVVHVEARAARLSRVDEPGRGTDRTSLFERLGTVLQGFRNLYQLCTVDDPADRAFPSKGFLFGWSAEDGNPDYPGFDAIFAVRARELRGPWEGYRGGGTWLASSQRPLGFGRWEPVIHAQASPYDAIHNGDPSVVKAGGRWFMAYSANGPNLDGIPYGSPGDTDGNLGCIMGATSGDGIHWRTSTRPILMNQSDVGSAPVTSGDAHAYGSYLRPSLMRDGGVFRLWFDYWLPGGGVSMGYAENRGDFADPGDWHVVRAGDGPCLESFPNPSVVRLGDLYFAYGDPPVTGDVATNGWQARKITEAVSPDGLRFHVLGHIEPELDVPAAHVPEALAREEDGRTWIYVFYSRQRGGDPYDYRYDEIRLMRREVTERERSRLRQWLRGQERASVPQ